MPSRYLNCIAAKRAFQAGDVRRGNELAALFTKEGESAPDALHDMQCMWYEVACGRAHLRQGKHGLALKRFLSVHKFFEDFKEDQFDFHTYCVRKTTLRAYVAMLRMEDDLFSHIFYAKVRVAFKACAARRMSCVYLTTSEF